MSKEEWGTIATFGALILGISLIDSRIAYIAMASIAFMMIVKHGNLTAISFPGKKPAATGEGQA